MGGLFSSNNPQRPPPRNQERGYIYSSRPSASSSYGNEDRWTPTYSASPTTSRTPSRVFSSEPNPTYYNSYYPTHTLTAGKSTTTPINNFNTYNNQNRLPTNFKSVPLQTRKISAPELCQVKINLFNLSQEPYYILTSRLASYIVLDDCDLEMSQVRRMITNKKNFKVDRISKIENPLLNKAYSLKKEQKQRDFPNLEERLLFHGTTWENVDGICDMNFNWRKCKTHLYGKGVSFSPNCNYAANYSDEGIQNKVMILAKVLVGRSCIGNQEMILPLQGCDTSQKSEGIVIVKYEDNEFLPVYKIEYHLINENKRKYKNQNANRKHGGQNLPLWQVQNYYDDLY